MSELGNSSETFRKDVTYDNYEKSQQAGLYPFSVKRIFGKTTGRGVRGGEEVGGG